MSFTMSNDKPSTIGSGERPGPSPGGIARFITLAEQSNQGPSVKTGGISGSVVAGKGIKRKYEAIMAVEKGVKAKKQIAADFGIPISTLSTWIKKGDEMKQKYLTGEMGSQRKKSRGAKFPEVRKARLAWYKNAREQNVTVSGKIMREKAKYFATKLGISDLEFDCSSGWLERFKVHHDISFKCVCGEANSIETNSVAMENWQTKLSKILQDYSPDQIYNGDETDIFYRLFLRSYKISLDQIYNANETGIFYRFVT